MTPCGEIWFNIGQDNDCCLTAPSHYIIKYSKLFDSWSNSLIVGSAQRHVSMSPPYKMISICQCQVLAVRWRIVAAQNRSAVVFDMWHRSAGANPFWGTGHGWVIKRLDIKVVGGRWSFWGPLSKLGSDSWNNSLIVGIYPAAKAETSVMSPPYININMSSVRSSDIHLRAIS